MGRVSSSESIELRYSTTSSDCALARIRISDDVVVVVVDCRIDGSFRGLLMDSLSLSAADKGWLFDGRSILEIPKIDVEKDRERV